MKKTVLLAAGIAAILHTTTSAARFSTGPTGIVHTGPVDQSTAAQADSLRTVRERTRHVDDEEKTPLVNFEIGKKGEDGAPPVTIQLTGTVRTKFEYQPTEGNARFDVRTARFGIGGALYSRFLYKMEIDLSDEGRIRMVDAYAGAKIYRGLTFNIGYMRVPFTIDAHRSPHLQIFANRSFIAKQVGGTRDVGAVLGWRFGRQIPLNIQLGMFNGSGLGADLRNYWTSSFNYSAKVQAGLADGMNLVASYRTDKPEAVRMHMYDVGLNYQNDRWLVEGEYLRKEYAGGAFTGVNAVDAFLSYGIPLHRGTFRRISFLGRYDYMGDHSNGIAADVGTEQTPQTSLVANDIERHRATVGVTFSLGLPFSADIRLNFEKYFYARHMAERIGVSDHDKIVVEFMAHF